MPFRDDRLRELLQIKGWKTADLHHATGIAYAPLGRYLKPRGESGAGEPSIDALAKIATKLEIDADFLIDTDHRYGDLPVLRAASHMALDRFFAERRRRGQSLETAEAEVLRRIADEHSEPPVWVSDWRKEHESGRLRTPPSTSESSTTYNPQLRRRMRRGRVS